MIYVRVELWPYGSQAHSRVLAEMRIANDGSGTRELGNYDVQATTGNSDKPIVGRVRRFSRGRLNVWYLVQRAVNCVVRRGEEQQNIEYFTRVFREVEQELREAEAKS